MYGIRRKNCKFTPENEWVRRVLNSVLCMIDLQTNNLMSKVLIIGAGGVGTVVAHKVAKMRSLPILCWLAVQSQNVIRLRLL